jgi:hypothetical protein
VSADLAVETESSDDPTDEELQARIETLEGEVERLRAELSEARRTSYRRSAIGLLFLGGLSLAGAGAFPGVRTVLLALGGTGVFGALLTYYLTPERFIGASVASGVYAALASNLEATTTELELADDAVYVPVDGDPSVRLYVPDQPPEVAGVPDAATLRNAFVVTADHRGLSLRPTGGSLYAEFDDTTTVPESPGELAAASGEALVEQFELVDAADPDVDEAGRATLRVTDSAYGPVDCFDHPVASFVATTFAAVLDEPVELEVTDADDATAYLVTCRWNLEESSV